MARSVRRATAVVAMVAVLAGIAACSDSSSTSTERGAAAGGVECPTLSNTEKGTVKIINKTRSPIILNVPATSWGCADWSGSYNPGGLEGREVKAGATANVLLEYKGIEARTDRYDVRGYTKSAPFLLQVATTPVSGTGWTPIAMGPDGGLQIMRNDRFSGKLAGRVDWTAKFDFTGITLDGQRIKVAWNGNTSSFELTLSN